MSSFHHSRRVRKAKSNATSKLVGTIVVSLVIVLLLISVALWFWGRKRTRHRAQQVMETRDKRQGIDSL
jgi:CHASE3 domain sensor protein